MKNFKIAKIDVIKHDKVVEPHIMVHPETGKQVQVSMQSEHDEYTEKGFEMGNQSTQQAAQQQGTFNVGGTYSDSIIDSDGNKPKKKTKKKKQHKEGGVDKYENLTGQYIEELPTRLLHKSDSEVEDDEYLKFPNGEIREAVGNSHDNGGIDLDLPDGTQILSDHLEVGKTLAKALKKEHNLNVKSTDTYAQVLSKYTKKLGLDGLNDTQAELFKMLEKEEKTPDSKTQKFNASYINTKALEIEDKKKVLGQEKSTMFSKLFEKQEATKPKKKNNEEFRFGGVSQSKIREIAEKNGLSLEKAMFLLGGEKGYYEDGDEVVETVVGSVGGGSEEEKRAIRLHEATLAGNIAGHQSRAGSFFGVEDEQIIARVEQYKNLLPELYDKFFASGDFSKENVLGFQQSYNKQADANLGYARDAMSAEQFARYKTQVEDSKFVEDKSSFRYTDAKLGRFTSSRPGFSSQLFNEKKTQALADIGITHLSQLINDPEKAKAVGLTTGDIEKAKTIKENNPDINFSLLPTKTAAEEIKPELEIDPVAGLTISPKPIVDDRAKGVVFPDQSLLPPGALEPHLLTRARRQRIDPVKIGVEEQLTEINRQAENVEEQLATLPANQRAAALSSILATTQQSGASAIAAVNRINAQQQQSAELFNVQQADAERQLQNASILNFEQRQLTAKAKTDKDLRDYLEFNRNVALNNLRNQQTLNMISTLSPDFELDLFGSAVTFDPSYNFQVGNDINPVK